jgi:hypothetical protein
MTGCTILVAICTMLPDQLNGNNVQKLQKKADHIRIQVQRQLNIFSKVQEDACVRTLD